MSYYLLTEFNGRAQVLTENYGNKLEMVEIGDIKLLFLMWTY